MEATRIVKLLIHGDHIELTKPRLFGGRGIAAIHPQSTTEENYRITLYDEFLSYVVSALEERFVNNPSHSVTIALHLSSECIKLMVPD